MKGRKPVRFVWAATTFVPAHEGRPACLYTIAGDAKGRTWERYSDMPSGVWLLMAGPEEPARQSRARE